MKNTIIFSLIVAALFALSCNDEPKLNKTEQTAVENQVQKDQKAMDSLENAIKALMDSTNGIDESDSMDVEE